MSSFDVAIVTLTNVAIGSPHASHYSIPEALAYTLSLPHPLPRTTYLTDFTHRVEHYRTDAMLVDWTKRLRSYRGTNGQVNSDKGGPSRPFGPAERGSRGWWTDVWDEVESEEQTLLVYPTTNREEELSISEEEAHERVPDVRCSYDGQVIHFSRSK